eukprot:815794-Prorocentrum_minimum.AAC.1
MTRPTATSTTAPPKDAAALDEPKPSNHAARAPAVYRSLNRPPRARPSAHPKLRKKKQIITNNASKRDLNYGKKPNNYQECASKRDVKAHLVGSPRLLLTTKYKL